MNKIKLFNFFKENEGVFHTSKYHFENYYEHCLLVIAEALKVAGNDETVVIAAALHDIAKPRTAGINKFGGACFYGHEQVTREEMAQFLPESDERFEDVYELVNLHMLPYHIACYKPEESKKKMEEVEKTHTSLFMERLNILHNCDEAGSVRSTEDMADISSRIQPAIEWLQA